MKRKINKLFSKKIVRFLFVGGINTLVGYGCFALLIFIGLNHNLAYIIATVIGVVNSYLWNKIFTFKSKEKSYSEALRFISVYLISFIIGLIILNVLINKLLINTYIAGAINIIFTTLISWIGHNKFSFKNKEGQDEKNI